MVDQSTQQFAFKALVVTFCVLLGAGFIFIGVVALQQGDGEAVRFAGALEPLILGAFLTIGGIVTGHNIMAAKVAVASITAGVVPPSMTVPASATPPAVVSVPHPATAPAPASQPLIPAAPSFAPDVQPTGEVAA